MSRTRFVKGTYTKISQKGHSMYSNESIITTAINWIQEVGEKIGVTYGDPATPPPTEIRAKCVVNFRSKDGWKGEDYGFDWMRLGETSVFGDINYEDIVAKQYTDSTYTTLVTDINSYNGSFKKSPTLFANLKRIYGTFSIPWKKKADGTPEDYYCSWVSLYPSQVKNSRTQKLEPSNFKNTKALLSLNIEVDEEPDALKFKANKFFSISPMEITTKSKGKHSLKDFVTIECLEEFTTDQMIEVIATKKNAAGVEVSEVAGRLKVWANHKPRRKKAKIVLIEVIAPIISTGNPGSSLGQKDLFERYLKQALIETEVQTEVLDISSDPKFQPGGSYVIDGQIAAYYFPSSLAPSGFHTLENYLYDKLKAQLKAANPADENKYDSYYKAFYLGEGGGYVDATGIVMGLNGYAQGRNVVLFPSKNDQTAAHEFLHSFNLPHSFTNLEADADALYTYEAIKTENLLDYSHRIPQVRYSLWKWQWEKANNSII